MQELVVFKGVLAFWKAWVMQTSAQTRCVMGTCEMAKCDKSLALASQRQADETPRQRHLVPICELLMSKGFECHLRPM